MLHVVITSEKVPFSYRVAGLGSRFLAWLVDLGLILLLLFVGLVIGGVLEVGRAGMALAVLLLWSFAVQWGYFLLFEWLWHGQTPGKRALGIRVIDWQGTSISFAQSALRNVLRVVDGLPLLLVDVIPPLLYGVGFLAAAGNRQQRRLGDWAAGTLVVHLLPSSRPLRIGAEAALAGPSIRETRARQRLQQLTRKQKETILDLYLRRDQLRFRERTRLFTAVADYFKTQMDLVPEEYESDEKFVTRLAEMLSKG